MRLVENEDNVRLATDKKHAFVNRATAEESQKPQNKCVAMHKQMHINQQRNAQIYLWFSFYIFINPNIFFACIRNVIVNRSVCI